MTINIRDFQHLEPPGIDGFPDLSAVARYIRRMYDALKLVRKGKIECVTQVTLSAGVASTVLQDSRISNQTVLVFDPLTANAAAEKANGTLYVTEANRTTGQVTITHANNAQVDREFLVALIG